jgi:hypothetical protein
VRRLSGRGHRFADLEYVAVALFGPRNRITALTKRFPLLGQDH